MRDLLIVLNPRRIEECTSAFSALPIDKLWVRSMSEYQIAHNWDYILGQAAEYQRLIVASDDGIVRPHALAEVQRVLNEGHPVATGYSNLASDDFRVNLTKTPQKRTLGPGAYNLYTLNEVMEYPDRNVPTYLTGMCLTAMSHPMWQRFGFRTYFDEPPGNASDFCLSEDLHDSNIPIVAAREAFVWHVKEKFNTLDRDPRKALYLHEKSELVWELA